MTQPEPGPAIYIVEPSELSLPRAALIELMQAVLAEGMPFHFRAKGWSMTPFIRDGDVVCVSPLPEAGPDAGDVVAFIRAETGQLLIHRVIATEGETYAIQGDNAPGAADVKVLRQEILGRVTRVTRNGRGVRLGLGPEGRLIAVLSRTGRLPRVRSLLGPLVRPFCRRPAD